MPIPSTRTDEFICDQEEDPYDDQPHRSSTDVNTLLMMLNILFNTSRRRNLDDSSPQTTLSYSIVEINTMDGLRLPFFLIIENPIHTEGFSIMNHSASSSELIENSSQTLDERNSHLVE